MTSSHCKTVPYTTVDHVNIADRVLLDEV